MPVFTTGDVAWTDAGTFRSYYATSSESRNHSLDFLGANSIAVSPGTFLIKIFDAKGILVWAIDYGDNLLTAANRYVRYPSASSVAAGKAVRLPWRWPNKYYYILDMILHIEKTLPTGYWVQVAK